jgi:hypothetical protein
MRNNLKADHQEEADRIWLNAAALLGISIARAADVYASWDGKGTLTLASEQYLDPDDCLAQMIFHELCHLLVSGEQAREQVDWGVDNTSPKDLVYEYATNRLQAALSQAYGLRTFMGVTTMWRPYYDALPRDPLATGDDAAIPLARSGLERARKAPYREVLHAALSGTAALADVLRSKVSADSLWLVTNAEHPAGFRRHPDSSLQCDDCAWAIPRAKGLQCRRTRPGCTPAYHGLGAVPDMQRARFDQAQPACEYFERKLTQEDCFSCGACCHKGFDVVEVQPTERFARRHPDLIEVRSAERCVVPRPNGHCVALTGNGSANAPFLCRHYDERPRSCRDFELGGDACLVARQRAALY